MTGGSQLIQDAAATLAETDPCLSRSFAPASQDHFISGFEEAALLAGEEFYFDAAIPG